MAQSAMTVRMDSNIKNQFDKLCQQFGMSANTAINIFINQVIRSRSIPFVISASDNSENIRREALSAFRSARMKAEKARAKSSLLKKSTRKSKRRERTENDLRSYLEMTSIFGNDSFSYSSRCPCPSYSRSRHSRIQSVLLF